MPLKIGLTGGIASGKSRVAECFAELGVPVIDADRIARQLVEPGSPMLEKIRRKFGEEFIDAQGALKRRQLRKHIFAHSEARAELEGLLHPAIRAEMARQARENESPYVLLVIPLLVETGQLDLVDRILVVDAPRAIQLERLCRRDRIDAEQAARILDAQASRGQRLAIADDVIPNSGSPEALCRAVAALHRKYLELAGRRGD